MLSNHYAVVNSKHRRFVVVNSGVPESKQDFFFFRIIKVYRKCVLGCLPIICCCCWVQQELTKTQTQTFESSIVSFAHTNEWYHFSPHSLYLHLWRNLTTWKHQRKNTFFLNPVFIQRLQKKNNLLQLIKTKANKRRVILVLFCSQTYYEWIAKRKVNIIRVLRLFLLVGKVLL